MYSKQMIPWTISNSLPKTLTCIVYAVMSLTVYFMSRLRFRVETTKHYKKLENYLY